MSNFESQQKQLTLFNISRGRGNVSSKGSLWEVNSNISCVHKSLSTRGISGYEQIDDVWIRVIAKSCRWITVKCKVTQIEAR